ncbi:dihydroxyacetone kinase subunit DhaL [Aestuariivirga sp.]|uniref:dihydroxyacetone kinase subunit DhaL n=1 Tax=Aestuariivirga sp. TaxID=2650926 RepID=UPI0039E5BCD0
MSSLSTQDVVTLFTHIASAIEAQKDHLSALDGVIGDADHGVTMAMGFNAVTAALAAAPPGDPTSAFNTAAKAFLNAVGASSGPLYATAFMRAAAAVKGKATLDRDAMVDVLSAMAKGMQDRGKAERGEKTMMDAWLPAAEAAREALAKDESAAACFAAAVAAGEAGAEATKNMVASKGRSSRLGERSLGHMDPGAASAVIILKEIQKAVAGM